MNNFRIETPFDLQNGFYKEGIQRIMNHLLPPNFFMKDNLYERFHANLPLISWTAIKEPPFQISFFLCCRFRLSAYRFFCEMISRWLVPGKRLNVLFEYAVDFTLPDIGNEKLIGGEILVEVNTQKELISFVKNLPIIESEIRLGVESFYHSNRILEIKGLTADEKTAMIQENIVSLIKHRPQDFDYDILSEMQHFMVLCKEEFKKPRSFRHMSRIISTHYLFKKALKLSYETFPDRRYISVKLIRTFIGDERKPILGVAIGISFLAENELLEQDHILNAIKSIIPGSKGIVSSFFHNSSRTDSIHTFYIEIEKEKAKFSLDEIKTLKRELPEILKRRIEKRINPIFMPENEEEIMRHILTLSSQLKYVRDLPQTIITFNKQYEGSLEFLVVFTRIISDNSRPLSEYFESKSSYLEFIPNRIKIVGSLRNKHKKEANVFYIKIKKDLFLRQDHSVDLYKARLEVFHGLTHILGEFRDYNGGTIAKERELFNNLKRLLGKKGVEQAFFLEEFFYALTPSIMRSVLAPDPLKKLFCMMMDIDKESITKEEEVIFKCDEDRKFCYILLISKDHIIKDKIQELMESSFPRTTISHISMKDHVIIALLSQRYQVNTLKTMRDAIENSLNVKN